MRPRGEVRMAMASAAKALADEAKGATWRDMAQRACVGMGVAQKTVKNMVLAGELQSIGTVRVAGARRPMSMYVPRENWVNNGLSLDNVLRSWSRS